LTDSNPANRRRSERVMLQIPVVVQAKTTDGKDVRENTQTVVVNAHGGLLKLKMEVKTGQPILLINERAKLQQGCHVVRVETSEAGNSAVAFEFDQPTPQFWPIVFPPADWAARS
jgi:PilZ domain